MKKNNLTRKLVAFSAVTLLAAATVRSASPARDPVADAFFFAAKEFRLIEKASIAAKQTTHTHGSSDPAQADASIRVLQDKSASQEAKFDAMLVFLDSANLTEVAFWALLDVALDRDNNKDEAVRSKAVFALATAIAYTHPTDFERGKFLIELMRGEKFNKYFMAIACDPAATVRQQRLYFFGATAVNTNPKLVKILTPVFLPMLLSSLASPGEEWSVKTEGLWSLSQLLEIKAVSIGEIARDLERSATSDPDESVRETAADLLESHRAELREQGYIELKNRIDLPQYCRSLAGESGAR